MVRRWTAAALTLSSLRPPHRPRRSVVSNGHCGVSVGYEIAKPVVFVNLGCSILTIFIAASDVAFSNAIVLPVRLDQIQFGWLAITACVLDSTIGVRLSSFICFKVARQKTSSPLFKVLAVQLNCLTPLAGFRIQPAKHDMPPVWGSR